MKKKRQVKEGSPFEEDNLIEMLLEEVRVSLVDQEQCRNIINALVYFSLIEQSTTLHELLA